ncbi:MAG: hypothetical protein JWP01_3906 [Myxococcales bacterium]|nr:hypothetical protein [Myxococcales bacterium]
MSSGRFASTFVTVSLLGALAGAACDNGKMHLHPPDGARDAYQAPWWTPKPGETKNWDIQVNPPFDLATARTMYIVDLWDVATPTTIEYGDMGPVSVPAGPLAGKVTELKAAGAKVICRVGTGAIRLTDPDARKFAGFEATPPDDPTPPAAGSVIGWHTRDADERFLDLRTASRALWQARLFKRFDLAKQLGCDGIEPDWIASFAAATGFTVTIDENIAWAKTVAAQAHERDLSVGMQNGTNGIVDQVAVDFDWLLAERCGEFDDCDTTRSFIALRKAVFAVDYQTDEEGNALPMSLLCGHQLDAQIEDGLIKDNALSSSYRATCM